MTEQEKDDARKKIAGIEDEPDNDEDWWDFLTSDED